MSQHCPPVAVEGWGGAGDACASSVAALEALAATQRMLRAASPEHWRSVAADGYLDRLAELLALADRAHRAVAEAHDGARRLAVEVAEAHQAAGR